MWRCEYIVVVIMVAVMTVVEQQLPCSGRALSGEGVEAGIEGPQAPRN